MESSECQSCKQTFSIESGDREFYASVQVPEPTFCARCRLQRRLAFQDQRALYKRKCDLCKRGIISMYDQNAEFPVYCMECWQSDKWNPLDYGVLYDFTKPFFVQFRELQRRVPRRSLIGLYQTWVNSEYNNMAHGLKDCYLLFNSDMNQGCMYGSEIESSEDCLDLTMADHCKLSYGSLGCRSCYRVYFSKDLEECSDVWFSRDCVNCSACFGCVNLKNASYHFFNEALSKEDYECAVREIYDGGFSGYEKARERFEGFERTFPRRYMHGRQNENVSGDYVYNSKYVRDSYIATGAENCRYCMWLIIKPNKDCYDFTQFGAGAERVYESITSGLQVSDLKFCLYCVQNCSRLTYCEHCSGGVSDCFGSSGLKKASYCILNKQYTEGEYRELVPRIIDHMNAMPYRDACGCEYRYGEFFPIEMSFFTYNETDAQEFFPISPEEAVSNGYAWREDEERETKPDVLWRDLPNKFAEVPDDFIQKLILCRAWDADVRAARSHRCTKVFRVTQRELVFLLEHNLPLPRECSNSRHYSRASQRTHPTEFFVRQCDCERVGHTHGGARCEIQFQTGYKPGEPFFVFCEKCYQAEVV